MLISFQFQSSVTFKSTSDFIFLLQLSALCIYLLLIHKMSAVFRDTALGQLIRFLSRGKVLRYPDEEENFPLLDYYAHLQGYERSLNNDGGNVASSGMFQFHAVFTKLLTNIQIPSKKTWKKMQRRRQNHPQ